MFLSIPKHKSKKLLKCLQTNKNQQQDKSCAQILGTALIIANGIPISNLKE